MSQCQTPLPALHSRQIVERLEEFLNSKIDEADAFERVSSPLTGAGLRCPAGSRPVHLLQRRAELTALGPPADAATNLTEDEKLAFGRGLGRAAYWCGKSGNAVAEEISVHWCRARR